MKKYDQYLVKLCELVVTGQKKNPKKYGMVGSCILDTDGNVVYAVSTNKNGKWRHAERNAIARYESKHGSVNKDCILFTTLSPCNSDSDDRYGESCTDLINATPIRKVYAGYIDPTQHDNHEEFQLKITKDTSVKKVCKMLADTFL
jgi:pyrimidine deaminase RibD-like protein